MKNRIPFLIQAATLSGNPDFPTIHSGASGSVAADGAITLKTPLPPYLAEVYYPLPPEAVCERSAGGWYLIEITSPTTGIVRERFAG